MPTASRPVFLRHFGRSRPERGPDLADMGTAFALDHALDQDEASTGPSGYPAPARAPVAVASWRRWLGRKLGA